jgi:hypothetical protein
LRRAAAGADPRSAGSPIYGAGALLAYLAGLRFHRLVSILCLIIALATVPNIAEAVHELYRNTADGECLG